MRRDPMGHDQMEICDPEVADGLAKLNTDIRPPHFSPLLQQSSTSGTLAMPYKPLAMAPITPFGPCQP
ncbi:uncharacterized [Tachysurus ichikawai]